MARFAIPQTDDLRIDREYPLSGYYTLSPFVWQENGHSHILLRVVNPSDNPAEKIARVYYGRGESDLHFEMDREPILAPGPDEDDQGGCEDPTLALAGGKYYVFYSGWNPNKQESSLLLASGPRLHALRKLGPVLPVAAQLRMTKEATVLAVSDGTWRLFFEFAQDDRSKIGLAAADTIDGPWEVRPPPFEARSNSWDVWHLSTGPVCAIHPGHQVMFYNGADCEGHWRIGWVIFNETYSEIVDRCEEPLIAPPAKKRDPEDTDIAFAASAVDEDGAINLYYSVADRWLTRAVITRDPGRGQ